VSRRFLNFGQMSKGLASLHLQRFNEEKQVVSDALLRFYIIEGYLSFPGLGIQ